LFDLFRSFSLLDIKGLLIKVTEVDSLENNALKTKSRTVYANYRNIAQNLFCLEQMKISPKTTAPF